MRQLLHIQPHEHTGKIIAHHHTSYRSLFILVTLVSLVLAGMQKSAGADEIIVSAKVAAPIPTQSTTITTTSNTTLTPLVVINGTCGIMSSASLIEIYSSGVFLGSTVCDTSGHFSVSVTLQPGTNTLVARTVNMTDDYGPDGVPVTMTYTPPPSGVSSSTPDGISHPGSNSQSNAHVQKLAIEGKYTHIVYGPYKDAEWVGSFEGGKSPYTATIAWGDGIVTAQYNVQSTELHVSHHYTDYATHFITVTVTDMDGRTIKQTLAAVTPYISSISTAISRTTTLCVPSAAADITSSYFGIGILSATACSITDAFINNPVVAGSTYATIALSVGLGFMSVKHRPILPVTKQRKKPARKRK